MLTILTRKLCPLMSLAIVTIGCGKKITEPDSKGASSVENSQTSSIYVLRFEGSQGSTNRFKFPGSGLFYIPEKLRVIAGSTAGKVVEIGYDVNEFDSDFFDFKCSYYPSSNPNEMELGKCWDQRGTYSDVDVSENTFDVNPQQITEIKVIGSDPRDFIVEAVYHIDWF